MFTGNVRKSSVERYIAKILEENAGKTNLEVAKVLVPKLIEIGMGPPLRTIPPTTPYDGIWMMVNEFEPE